MATTTRLSVEQEEELVHLSKIWTQPHAHRPYIQLDEQMAYVAYSDKLMEMGYPLRAEYIQNAIAMEDTAITPERRQELNDRQLEITPAVFKQWFGVLADQFAQPYEDGPPLAAEQLRAYFRFGVPSIEVTAQMLLRDDVRQNLPPVLLSRVQLQPFSNDVALLEKCTDLPPIGHLTLNTYHIKDEQAARCLACLQSPYLRELTLIEHSPDFPRPNSVDAQLKQVANSPYSQNLFALSFMGNSSHAMGDAGLAILAASPHLKNLYKLSLDTQQISPRGCTYLPQFTHLETLMLHSNNLNPRVTPPSPPEAMAPPPAIENIAKLKNLRTLDLSQCEIDSVQALSQLPKLEELKVDLNWLKQGALVPLFADAAQCRLRKLNASRNHVDNVDAEAIAHSNRANQLDTLSLQTTHITDQGGSVLAGSDKLPALAHLDLSATQVGAATAASLAATPQRATLETLNLTHSPIGDADVRAIATSCHLTGLREMFLNGTSATLTSAAILGESTLPSLRKISFSCTPRADHNVMALVFANSRARASAQASMSDAELPLPSLERFNSKTVDELRHLHLEYGQQQPGRGGGPAR